jgi:hypothetical protein
LITAILSISGQKVLPRRSLFGLWLRLVAVRHWARQQTATATHRDSLLEAQGVVARLHARGHMRRMRVLQHMTRYRSHRHVGWSSWRHMWSVGGRSVQFGEVDVGRLQLQGRRLVRRRRQPATLTPPRDQHRVTMLMRVMAMMMMVRTTTAYRARAPRTLLQTGRAVMAAALDPVNRTRRPGWTRRGAPWT